MASQPSDAESAGGAYARGWGAVTRAMDAGASWSGHERDTAYLNLGGARFVDVSAVTGLDFADDGRAAAELDWDGDGAPDLVLRNRSGPGLRLLHGARAGGRAIALRLTGTRSNRDAVGARVELQTAGPSSTGGGRTLVREVRAGDGYLAQSTRWLHFGLREDEAVERLVVRWPGTGVEEPALDVLAGAGAKDGTRWVLVEGSGELTPLPARDAGVERLGEGALEPLAGGAARVVLRTPLPLAPSVARALSEGLAPDRARLVNLWAHWCAPCVSELAELAARSDELAAAGLDVVPFSVDAPEDRAAAAELFERRIATEMASPGFAPREAPDALLDVVQALAAHVVPDQGELALPTSLLVDRHGWVQVLHRGPVEVEQLLADARTYGMAPREVGVRSALGGRWFFGAPRDLGALARELAARGHRREAAFYETLARRR